MGNTWCFLFSLLNHFSKKLFKHSKVIHILPQLAIVWEGKVLAHLLLRDECFFSYVHDKNIKNLIAQEPWKLSNFGRNIRRLILCKGRSFRFPLFPSFHTAEN